MRIVFKVILFAFYGALIGIALITTIGGVWGLIYGDPWEPSRQFPDLTGMVLVALLFLVDMGFDAAFLGAVSGFVFGGFRAYQALGSNRRTSLSRENNVPNSLRHSITDIDYVDQRLNSQRPWQD